MESNRSDDLTEPLLDLADVCAQILAHMARSYVRSAPDAPPPGVVFRQLLGETLSPLVERHPPPTLRATRQLLTEAVATIEAEIFLVDLREGGSRPRLPRRRC
jgi:hypothetical protein